MNKLFIICLGLVQIVAWITSAILAYGIFMSPDDWTLYAMTVLMILLALLLRAWGKSRVIAEEYKMYKKE